MDSWRVNFFHAFITNTKLSIKLHADDAQKLFIYMFISNKIIHTAKPNTYNFQET